MKTRAQLNRAVRQEALREQLAQGKHVEHVLDIAKRLANPAEDIPQEMVARYRIVIDTKLKLIGKYLPDLKAVEHSTTPDDPLKDVLAEIMKKQDGLPHDRSGGH